MCWRIDVVDTTTEMMMDLTSVSDQEQNFTLTDQDLESEPDPYPESNPRDIFIKTLTSEREWQ